MKKTLLICCVLFFISCSSFLTNEHKLNVTVTILEEQDAHQYLDTGILYSCIVELENNTDSIIRFWSMNCSWQDCWITNKSNILIWGSNCDRNFPEVFTLRKDSIIKYRGMIHIPKPELLNCDSLKLGFLYVREDEFLLKGENFYEILRIRKRENKGIVWSDYFTIPRLHL